MTNLLIPSDFTPATLKLAAQAVTVLNREVNIVLFHAFDMPFYTQDMFRPERHPWQEVLTDEFRQGCKRLKEEYPWFINSINFKYMQGNTNALFRNWCDANDIDMIACPHNYVYTKIHERSLNPVNFFKKSGLPLLQEFKTTRTVVITKGAEQRKADYSAISSQ